MQRIPRLWLILLLIHLFSGASVRAAITVAGYWRLGENDTGAAAGITATNSTDSASTNNLTFNGNARYANDVALSAAANTSSSLSVNFSNSSYATTALISAAADNFGIECWVKPTTTGANEVIAYNGVTGGAGSSGWGLFIAANNTYEALYGGVTDFGTNVATPNVWTHLALVRAGGISTLYVNGFPTVTSPVGPIPPSGSSLHFALATPPQSPTSQFFTGLIDEVRVFTFATNQFSTSDLLVYKDTSFALSSTNLVEGFAGGTDFVHLTITPPGAYWTASSNATWLHLLSASGTGNTNVAFSFDANPGPTRTGTFTIAGKTLTVTQAGSNYVAAQMATLVSSGLNTPQALAVDGAGNIYIADSTNNALKLWNATNQTMTTLIPSGLSDPIGLAVDSSNNVYIADRGNSAIKEWITASGIVTNLVTSGLNGPRGVAVDGAGNVYIADTQDDAIKEWHAASNTVTTLVTSGSIFPFGVGVDAVGNVYVTDSTNNALEEWVAASNSVTTLVSAGLNSPEGLVVDSAGNVYFADNVNNAIKKWNALSNTVINLVSTGLNRPGDVVVDGAGSIYIADSGNNAIKELPRLFLDNSTRVELAAAGNDSLPPVVPASFNLSGFFYPTSDQPWLTITGAGNGVVTYAFAGNPTMLDRTAHITLLGWQIPVVQQGLFTLSSGSRLEGPSSDMDSVWLTGAPLDAWTASANVSWLHLLNASGTGSTNIVFSFDANPGPTRSGTLTIAGLTLMVTQVGTSFVAASAPVLFFSGTAFVPYGVAVGDFDNIWFDDNHNNSIYLGSANNPGASPFPVTGLSQPTGMAVDAAGSLYVADTGNSNIKEWSATTSTETNIGSPGSIVASSVAVDGAGNIYASNGGPVQKWNPTNQTFQPMHFGGEILGVDGANDVYVAIGNSIAVWNPGGFFSSGVGLNNTVASGAVDAAGNVWFAYSATQTNAIEKWNAGNRNVTTVASVPLSIITGMALDREGDVFFCDQQTDTIQELPHVFVDAMPQFVSGVAGSGSFQVFPASSPIINYTYPTSDQPWLGFTGANPGVVYFSFAENDTGTNRVGHLTELGVSVTVTQSFLVTPPVITGVSRPGNGLLQLGFTNNPNLTFTVLATTNLALPFGDWSVLGTAINLGGGNFQFTTPTTNGPRMFYRVRYP